MQASLVAQRIHPTFSSPRDHPQNGDSENRVRVVKRDARINARSSGAPNPMWGELFNYNLFTRNNLCSVFFEGKWITPDMRLRSPGAKQFNFELLLPFGCRVTTTDVEPTGPQNLDQVVSHECFMVGYGESTGHGGGYRVLRESDKRVYISSFNHTIANESAFRWRKAMYAQ